MSILAGEKFELKLIRASDILLHEECEDNRYGRLVERFEQEKVLYNPLIVGRFNDQFILIDGANRFEALIRTGCKIILAQLVNYSSPEVKLRSWYHFVNEMVLDELKGFLQASGIGWNHGKVRRFQYRFHSVGLSHQTVKPYLSNAVMYLRNLKTLCMLSKYYEAHSYSELTAIPILGWRVFT
jgi:hypothetical protein